MSERWYDRWQPTSHDGSCTWLTHPTHRLRNWVVWLIDKATRWVEAK